MRRKKLQILTQHMPGVFVRVIMDSERNVEENNLPIFKKIVL